VSPWGRQEREPEIRQGIALAQQVGHRPVHRSLQLGPHPLPPAGPRAAGFTTDLWTLARVTRARHTGITSFFITNTPTALPEGVLRAADNLFIFRLPLEEDIKWAAKSGMIEESSLLALVQALPKYACLALGEATAGYPLVLLPDPLVGVDTRGKTRYFFI